MVHEQGISIESRSDDKIEEYLQQQIEPGQAFREFARVEIERSLWESFSQQVSRTPQNLAIKTKNYQWTYTELERTAEGVARIVLDKCGGGEQRIALLLEHDAPAIAAILGILKAGKSYVPLDPNYPRERLAYILEDSQATAVVTNKQNLALAVELSLEEMILVNIDEVNAAGAGSANASEIAPDTLAYILYTSGSTGVPKGVMQNHRNVLHFIRNYTNNLKIAPTDRLTLLSSISFSAAVVDIFTALLNGATLYPFDIKSEGLAPLPEYLRQSGITIYHSTPTVYRHLMSNLSAAEKLPQIRLIVLGGEEVKPQDVEIYQQHFSADCTFVNNMGATESAITLQYFLTKLPEVGKKVPVGYPIEETEIILLDDNGQVTDFYGEIGILSPYLALGYWQQPHLTEKVFCAHPDDGNRRMYRTGDIGRLRPDGSLEFIGRKYFQVKLRGYRIELGEIEAALVQHSQVKEAVVIAREDIPGDKRLVAYIVKNQSQPIISELRSFANSKLPDYMIPAVFVILESLPLTPNGKINRRALPAPELDSSLEANFVPPQTSDQKLLAAIYGEVLRLKKVGIHDNFFELGGHSLLATQVISRLRETFAVGISLRNIFEAPTVAKLEAQLNRIRNRKEQLPVAPAIGKGTREELPLSFAQERLWFLYQLQEWNKSTYNLSCVLQLMGELNIDALKGALREIICRHQVLRTQFQLVDGMPIQVIDKSCQLNLPVIDLREFSESEQSSRVQQLAAASAKEAFNLEQTPLMRASLLQLSNQKYILLLNVHHIAFDGWSWGIFRQELSVIYTALISAQPSPLAELPVQYADYAAWQRQWLQGEVLESQLNYWKQQLSGELPVLELPIDYPRPRVQAFTGGKTSIKLSSELTLSLQELSRKSGVTLYMTLLAAFFVLLSRYSGQSDLLVGTPIANRQLSELEGLLGFFVNTLVLRTNLGDNPSFRELLGRVRETALGAYEHQDMPFEKLVEQLQRSRDLSRNPLFQVMFALQNVPSRKWELPHLAVTPLSVENLTAKFDLSLELWETETGLEGRWEYNADLFKGETIERMSGNFSTLLEGIVAAPEQKVGFLPLLTPKERHQLLVSWNDTFASYPQDKCIHQLFEEQVERTPDAVAVVFELEQITYRELNAKANQLARYLQSVGVGPEILVGICLERSIETIVGLLGILKAGGAYLPLDPNYPSERLAYMLEDSGISVLLTSERLVEQLPSNNVRAIYLDSPQAILASKSQENTDNRAKPDNLAYIIYTSGSTGKPKGVMVTHQGLCNLAKTQIKMFYLQQNSRILQFASLSFDASIWEIVMSLCSGARLYMGTSESLRPGPDLIELLQKQEITHVTLPPSVLATLKKQDLPRLQNIIVAGETCTKDLLEEWSVGRRFFNAYGPTESTVCASVAECTNGDRNLPIGRPINNIQIYILDNNLQPVPIGVPGELHIGGAGLARGYLNRPELTAQKFIPNPFSQEEGSRLYKTGDLARYLADGNIEFIGRIDNQVKIRGFRIELREIEAVLTEHPKVGKAVVIVREDIPGDKRLAAYIVAKEEVASSDLRGFLKSTVPDYMVPSAFVFLDAIPLTPNGKIDRRALPVPDVSTQEAERIAPRTTTELQLVQIWSEVLNISSVGVRDNFFDLGGHSLLAVRLMVRIEEQFGTLLPLTTLFTEPTIQEQAGLLSAAPKSQLSSPLVPIKSTGSLPPFFCIHPGGGNILCYAVLARQLAPEQPFYALQALGLNGERKPLTRIETMATTYIKAIQAVRPRGPYRLGGWSFGGIVAFEIARQLEALGAEVEMLALIDSFNPTTLNKTKQDEAMLVISFAQDLSGYFDKELPASAEEMRQLELEEKLNYILKQGKKLQILPPEIGLEQMQQLFAVFQANVQAMHAYVPQPYSGQITLFYADGKSEELAQKQIQGWSSLTVAGINIHKIPGDHFSIIRSEVLAKELVPLRGSQKSEVRSQKY
ncbi:MAG: amino acid adenylation domain-containing protein [Cyanobacteria bacterium P01_H01_bin.35]